MHLLTVDVLLGHPLKNKTCAKVPVVLLGKHLRRAECLADNLVNAVDENTP